MLGVGLAFAQLYNCPSFSNGVGLGGYAVHPAGYAFDIPAALQVRIAHAAPGAAIYAWAAAAGQWQRLATTASDRGRLLSAPVPRLDAAPALYTVLAPHGAPPAPVLLAPPGGRAASPILTLAGLARTGDAVQVRDDGHHAGDGAMGADGLVVLEVRLHRGVNHLTAVALDAAGHVSAISSATVVTYSPARASASRPLSLRQQPADSAAAQRGRTGGAPPPAPTIASATHPAMLASDFARAGDMWLGGATPLGAQVSVAAGRAARGHAAALRVTAGPTGELTAFLPIASSYDLSTHPFLDFAYNVPSDLSMDLAVHANGTWWVFGLSDGPPDAVDFQRTYVYPIFVGGQSLRRDDRWHALRLDIYGLIREQVLTGTITVDRVAFGDWEQGGWMAVRPARSNPPGASFLLDDVAIPAVSRRPYVVFTWSGHSPTGITAYSYALDGHPRTVPPARATTTSTRLTVGPLASGTYWLHVRARGRDGVWGPAAHYPVAVDTLPPLAGAPDPPPGGTGDAFVQVPLRDPGGSGIDAASLRFSAFGRVYGPNSGAVSYNRAAGTAQLDLGRVQPAPRDLFPGGKVPVALLAASDVAGNRLAQPLAWTYTLDIPNGLPGGPQLLTTRGGDAPTFSPDATRVAFISSRAGGRRLWTIDAGDLAERHGSARRIVSGPGADADPAWSPRADLIAFASTRGGSWRLYVVAPNGRGLRQITSGRGRDAHPTWSPDGKRLAFVRDGNLFVVNRDGSGLRALVADGDRAVREPVWSPDGRLIAYRHSLYVDQIWTVRPDGTHAHALTSLADGEAQSQPAWLADGRLAYISLRHGVSALYAVYPDGTDQYPLLGQPPAQLFAPVASRDGAATAFASTRTGGHNIFVSRTFMVDPFDASAARFDVAAGATVRLRYGLSSVATVSLSVVDASGRAVRTLLHNQRQSMGTRTMVWDGKDAHGAALPEGDYSLSIAATAPGLPPLRRGVGVSIDDVSLHGTLRAHLQRGGRPAADVGVTVLRAGSDTFVADVSSGASGAATFSLSPGGYDVTAQSDRGEGGSLKAITIARGRTVERSIALVAPTPVPIVTAAPTAPAAGTATATPPGAGATTTSTATTAPLGSATTTPTSMPTVPAGSATPTPETISTPSDSAKGVLAVTILQAPGKPASGALVRVLKAGKEIDITITDSQGIGTFTLDPGSYDLTVAYGNAKGSASDIAVTAGGIARRTIDVNVGTLVVTVLQASGKPAAGALIRAYQGTTEADVHISDAHGMATFTLAAGSYDLKAEFGSATATTKGVRVSAGQTAQATINASAGTLVVTVVQAPGKPAVGALVRALQGTKEADIHLTDDHGLATFTLAAGTYDLKAELGSATATAHGVRVTAGVTASATIDVNAGTLVVTVLTLAGQPATSVLVRALQGSNEVDIHLTDAHGIATFTLAAGTYTLQAEISSTSTKRVNGVRVTAGQTALTTVRCRVPSAECRVPSAECRVPSAECRVPSAECRVLLGADTLDTVEPVDNSGGSSKI